jgi:membrane-bound lytic murein transglycosylase D
VPKFLAVSYILSNPRRFGLPYRWDEDPRWEQVRVAKQVDLGILAREAGIDGEVLKRANRELRYNVTPPGEYPIKVRGAEAEKLRETLERGDIPLLAYYRHTIKSGDTLLALALHYGISVETIMAANPGLKPRYLKLGTSLLIPALKEVGPYRQRPPGGDLAFEGNHLVKKGETLWAIALAYGVDPETLAEANGIGLDDILREGRTLKTPIVK